MRYVVLSLLIMGIAGCREKQPEYLQGISELEDATYLTFDIQKTKWNDRDTLKISPWLNPSDLDQIAIDFFGDIAPYRSGYIVSDLERGNIYHIDNNAQLIDTLAVKGKGPGEFMNPSAIAYAASATDTIYYILDTSLNLIKTIDSGGNFKEAWGHLTLPFSNWQNQLSVTANHIFWASQHIDNHVLIKAGLDGKVIEKTIDRIIPQGKQPSTYNAIVFDVSEHEDEITFAYTGLSLIFYQSQNGKIAINLRPNKEIEEINTPLQVMPENKRVQVKNLVRAVYLLNKNQLLAAYESQIIRYKRDSKKGRVYTLYSKSSNEQVKFHKMIKIDSYLFIINLFSGKIYKVNMNTLNR